MKEEHFGKGARKLNPIKRKWRKLLRKKLGRASAPVDWSVPFDVEDKVGAQPNKNQGQSSSCSGQSGAYFVQTQELLRGNQCPEISAKSIYSPIAHPGGGATVTDLISQVGSMGANLESKVHSYYVDGSPLSEADYIEKSWQTPSASADAVMRAGYTPYDISDNMEDIARAVRDYGGAFVELAGQNGNDPGWLSDTPLPPQKSNTSEKWYHFLWIKGYCTRNGEKCLIVRNSWGSNIGLNGVQFLTEDYVPYFEDAFTMIPDSRPLPKGNYSPIWLAIRDWFVRLQFKLK